MNPTPSACPELPDQDDSLIGSFLVAAALVGVLGLAWYAYRYAACPYFRDPYEGAQYVAAVRWLGGLPAYPEYATEGAVTMYPPLGFLLGAASMAVLGHGVLAFKLPFVTAILLAAVAIFLGARGLTGRGSHGLVAVGMFAALYPWTGYRYFDARPDAIACGVVVWGALLAAKPTGSAGRSGMAPLVAAVLMGLSVLLKQPFLAVVVFFAAYLAWSRQWRPFALTLATALAVASVALVVFDRGGEYMVSHLWQAVHHPMKPLREVVLSCMETGAGLVPVLLFMLLLGAGNLAPSLGRDELRVWLFVALGALVSGLPAYVKVEGARNNFVVLAGVVSVLGAAGAAVARSPEAGLSRRGRSCVALGVVFFLLLNAPLPMGRFAAQLSACEEEQGAATAFILSQAATPFLPQHNYLGLAAGRGAELDDVANDNWVIAGHQAPLRIQERLRRGAYPSVLGRFKTPALQRLLEECYERVVPTPVKGWELWKPKSR